MPRNSEDVPRNAPDSHLVEDGGKKRSERLRARRDEAGLAQVSGWVPKERRAFAREVLAALARGANSLPPDPDQAVELNAACAVAAQARMGEATARVELTQVEERARDAGHQAELAEEARSAALARAEAAEREREEAARELATVRAEVEAAQKRERAAQETVDALRGELAGIRGRGGWRGVLLRLAGADRRA